MAGKGHPRAFKTDEVFKQTFKKYIDYCVETKRFPNIAGFCVFADITRETFYAQKNYYSDTYTKVRDMLEDEVLQHNTYMAQLYIKNTFGMSDKQEIVSHNTNVEMSVEEAKEYLESLSEEDKKKLLGGK